MTKTLKRVIALLSVSMFMALFSLSCFAQENSSAKKIYTEDLGDGITAVVTLSETNGMARSSKTYNVTKEYYKDGTYIGVALYTHPSITMVLLPVLLQQAEREQVLTGGAMEIKRHGLAETVPI